MANPQLEDGYLRIANELMDALIKIRIPGEASQVLLFIVRKTYGFQKKADVISLSQFVEATGIVKSHVVRALRKLETMRIIRKTVTQKGNGAGASYSLRKDYEKWKPLPKKVTVTQKGNKGYPKKVIGVPQKGNEALPKKGTTKDIYKDNITKDNITKDNIAHSEKIPFQEIIESLNLLAGTNYRWKSEEAVKTRSLIQVRWKEGFRLDDFKRVHISKCNDWLNTDQSKYLRPETLYGTKFEGYLNQKTRDREYSDLTRRNMQVVKEVLADGK